MSQQQKSLAERVKSILAFHVLLAGPAGSEVEIKIHSEISELLDFEEKPTREKLERIKSFIRLYGILFSYGQFISDEENTESIEQLLEYIDSLMPQNNFVLARRDFVPATLGKKSIESGLSIPLFGYFRSPNVPDVPGILLCYQSIESGLFASIELFVKNEQTQIQYTHLGLAIIRSAPSIAMRIANQGHDPFVSLKPPFPQKQWLLFQNNRYDAYLATTSITYKNEKEIFEPLEYRYVYFFEEGNNQRLRIVQYLRDLLVSMYSFTYIKAQEIAQELAIRL